MAKTITKLAGSIREYKKEAILTPILMVIEVGMEVLIPLIISQFGTCIQKADMNGMLLYGISMIVAALISLMAGMLGGKFCAKASTGFAKNLRNDMFENIQHFSFANIDKFSSSSLVTRLTTDVTNVQMSYMMLIRTAIRSPLMLIFSIIMSFAISPTLPTVFFVILNSEGVKLAPKYCKRPFKVKADLGIFVKLSAKPYNV